MKRLVLLLVLCVCFSGCGEAASVAVIGGADGPADIVVTNDEPALLYYADENAEGLVAEEYVISEKTPEAVLEALFNGPYDESSVSVFGEGTRLLGLDITAGEATVDLSEEFLKSTGDSLAIYSVVNTLTCFEEISFVRITVEGSENASLGNFILSESFTRNDSLMK